MRTTAICNQKGGIGKSTTAQALAVGLHYKGYKALIIDLDSQGNISYSTGADMTRPGIYEALKRQSDIKDTIQTTPHGHIIASNINLSGADLEFKTAGRDSLLKNLLEGLKYDYVIIDTPPHLGILTINALAAATDIIIPIGADIFSLQGLTQLYNTVKQVQQYCNPELYICGLLLTRYNERLILSRDFRDIVADKAQALGTKLFNAAIRESVTVREAQAQRLPLQQYAPTSNPALDYINFINEYLQEEAKHGKKEGI